jgi:hypothetical protein
MSKNRRMSAAQCPYYHVLEGLQQKTSKNFIFVRERFFRFALGATADKSAETGGFGGASFAGVEQEITEITERKPADLEGRH